MGKNVFLLCGVVVQNLFIQSRKKCDRQSTSRYTNNTKSNLSTETIPQIHDSFTTTPHHLSPAPYGLSPLMNTTFTQFPQSLLLLKRNEI